MLLLPRARALFRRSEFTFIDLPIDFLDHVVAAADAYQIDSTYLAADQVVEQILGLAREKKLVEPESAR